MDKKKFFRCRAENSVVSSKLEFSRRFGVGQIVDFNEKIGEDEKGDPIMLAAVIRSGCFEEVIEAAPAAPELEAAPEFPAARPKKKQSTRTRGNK